MTEKKLEYSLRNGFIENWLISGPHQEFLPKNIQPGKVWKQNVLSPELLFKNPLLIEGTPQESAKSILGKIELSWNYYHCLDDHLVSITTRCPHWQILSAWAYAQLVFPDRINCTLNLYSDKAVQLWLNGELIYTSLSALDKFEPQAIQVTFEKSNELYVQFSTVSVGESCNQFALQMKNLPSDEFEKNVKVFLPTIARFPHRFQIFENLFENVYLEDIVHYRGDHFFMRWMEDIRDSTYFTWEIQDKKGAYYVQGNAQPDAQKPKDVGHGYRLFERPFWLALRPTGREFFEQNIRYTKRLPIHILDNKYSDTLYGSPAERRQEALVDATKHENNLFAMLARMELNRWDDLLPSTVTNAIVRVKDQEIDSERLLMGFLIMLYRYSKNPSFPQEWIHPIQEAILSFNYQEVVEIPNSIDYARESSQLLILASEFLAGQKYPGSTFKVSGLPGEKHLEQSINSLQNWLLRRGQYGFEDWNSNSDIGYLFLALSQLITYSENEHISELSTVLLDKLIFLLAVNSYKGIFSACRGRADATMLKSAQLDTSSGIMRMLWGMGVYNHHIEGVIGLALSDYDFPSFFKEIATSNQPELLSKESHISKSGIETNTTTYKTPDYMLSSAQDYQPGSSGSYQHIWQATFSPEAVVFVNHPANSSEEPTCQPGFWSGNAILPRTFQWKDVLISIHNLPENDWMGYTHAYFPLPAFDDFFFTEKWNFLRKGSGYLAITASCGSEFIRQGNNAYRELRSYGHQNIWVCQLGRESLDGGFDKFRNKVMALPLEFNDLSVKFTSLRGDGLSMGWSEPLLVNNIEQPLHGYNHIDNPFCLAAIPARQIDIQHNDLLLRLNFE